MADLKYVKWQVAGGWGYGEVVKADVTDTESEVQLPSQSIVNVPTAELREINEAEYRKEVAALAAKLSEIGDAEMNKELETKLEEATAKIADLEKQLADANTESETKAAEATEALATANKEKEDAVASAAEANEKLAAIEAERRGEARFAEIKELDGLVALGTDKEDEAKTKLADMSEDAYAQLKNLAEAFVKTTDVTETAAPNSTDQTVTTESKLTDQTVTSALEETDSNEETNEEVVESSTNEKSSFAAAMAEFIGNDK